MAPPQQPYPGMYYMPMSPDQVLSRRTVWILNAFGLAIIWVGFLIWLSGSRDATFLAFARFIVFSGGTLGALISTAAALGSRRTTDMQNLGLFVWAGILLFTAATVASFIR